MEALAVLFPAAEEGDCPESSEGSAFLGELLFAWEPLSGLGSILLKSPDLAMMMTVSRATQATTATAATAIPTAGLCSAFRRGEEPFCQEALPVLPEADWEAAPELYCEAAPELYWPEAPVCPAEPFCQEALPCP